MTMERRGYGLFPLGITYTAPLAMEILFGLLRLPLTERSALESRMVKLIWRVQKVHSCWKVTPAPSTQSHFLAMAPNWGLPVPMGPREFGVPRMERRSKS